MVPLMRVPQNFCVAIVNTNPSARATLQDVAREAGVGLATVDRVLNQRPGVRERTRSRVVDAAQRLKYRPDPAAARLAQQRPHRVGVVLPSGSNSFVAMLRRQVDENRLWMDDHRMRGQVREVDVFEPAALARCLHALKPGCDTVILMALDHPLVRAAIDDLVDAGRCVITLVSDVPSSRRQHFVGIDNIAAGRTAATLLGRFVRARRGTVGVVVGSLALRDHAERCAGFGQVMAADHPRLALLPVIEGKDDSALTEGLVARLLAEQADLAGLYSVGGGNRGIGAALRASGRAKNVVFIAHELTPAARAYLQDGTLDAVISQDAGREMRSALRLADAHSRRQPMDGSHERIRIDIHLKDNLP